MEKTVDEMFSNIEDPRQDWKVKHKLSEILFIALCTLLSNGVDFEDMVSFTKERYEWLKKFIDLRNGIPSHDTFNRVFQLIEPTQLMKILQEDGSGIIKDLKEKHISFDGKKARGHAPKSKGVNGLYIVSAWVNENQICIGQQKVDDKSNEITAIPQLLDSIDIQGSTITIDAIGTQENIVEKIQSENADYILALKQNQKTLYQQVDDELIWTQVPALVIDTTEDKKHGRKEVRKCKVISAQGFLEKSFIDKWKGLKSLVRIDYERTENGTVSSNTRYYISSKLGNAKYFNQAIRGHWSIENQLHWHLDVTFDEDKNRSRIGHSQVNLNIMRKTALTRIKKSNEKLSLKKRRFKASLNQAYLENLIFQ